MAVCQLLDGRRSRAGAARQMSRLNRLPVKSHIHERQGWLGPRYTRSGQRAETPHIACGGAAKAVERRS